MHISAFGAALRTPDLRKKILFTLGLLGLYRLGAVLPTPGVDYAAIQRCIDVVQDNSVYALINPGNRTHRKSTPIDLLAESCRYRSA